MAEADEAAVRVPEPGYGKQQQCDREQRLRERQGIVAVAHLLDDKTSQHQRGNQQEEDQAVEKIDREGQHAAGRLDAHQHDCERNDRQAERHQQDQRLLESLADEKMRHHPDEQHRQQIDRREH